MKARTFVSALCKKISARSDVILEECRLSYLHETYPFLKLKSREILPSDSVILIVAGIHGDEVAGPLTIIRHANEIIDYLHARNLKGIIYPLCNPDGFERGERYSSSVNNDFLRYELASGDIVDSIGLGDKFIKWHWSSDEKLGINLPEETRLMHTLLKCDPLSQVVACIDIHQDCETKGAPPAAYHYAFGDLNRYGEIIRKIKRLVPLFKNQEISAGYANGIAAKSDEQGFIIRHDGALTDLMWRLGASHSVTIETTGATPLNVALEVNLTWILGIADLITNEEQKNA